MRFSEPINMTQAFNNVNKKMKNHGNTLGILKHVGGRTNMTRGGGYPILPGLSHLKR
jgi:hypothetical protein